MLLILQPTVKWTLMETQGQGRMNMMTAKVASGEFQGVG